MTKQVIMQVLPELDMGGVERGTIEIATALKKAGIENIVVSAGGKLTANLARLKVPHITLPVQTKNPFKILINAFKLKKIIRQYHVELMHVRSRAPAFSVALASRMTGVPFITTFHGVYGHQNAFKRWYNSIMTKGKLVITVSDYVRQHVMKTYHIPESKIRLIHRGADTDYFEVGSVKVHQIEDFIKQYGIDLNGPIVTLVGRLTRWKGQLVLLEALRQLKGPITCLLVGSAQGRDKYVAEIKEAMKKLPEDIGVYIITNSPDMPTVYALSNVVINASLDPEAFGRVIPEAQSMGCLVIGTAHGGAAETIADGETGFLVPPGDPKALADKIKEVLALPKKEKEEIQTKAIKSVQENFSTNMMCAKTLAVYREVLDDHEA